MEIPGQRLGTMQPKARKATKNTSTPKHNQDTATLTAPLRDQQTSITTHPPAPCLKIASPMQKPKETTATFGNHNPPTNLLRDSIRTQNLSSQPPLTKNSLSHPTSDFFISEGQELNATFKHSAPKLGLATEPLNPDGNPSSALRRDDSGKCKAKPCCYLSHP